MTADPLRYRVRHLTGYQYSGRVDLCHNLAHLTPRETEGTTILAHQIEIDPWPDFQSGGIDYFGNQESFFSIQSPHEHLNVISTFTLEKTSFDPGGLSGVAWDNYPPTGGSTDEGDVLIEDYRVPSLACPRLSSLRDYLKPSLRTGRDLLDLGDEVMGRIHAEFTFSPGATEISTPVATVLENRSGVCQDFAHLMISCFRTLGIPARYVSGYLETLPPPGKPKLQGADASHAWVEIFAPGRGWTGFDPTNNQRPADRHIKLCHGRDYFDVQPVQGIFLGSGSHTLHVEVDVERV